MKRFLQHNILILVLSGMMCSGFSALFSQEYPDASIPSLVGDDTLHREGLSFSLNTQGFIYDAEFFNPVEPGYTLLGFQGQPEILYRPVSSLTLGGGVYFLKYAGMDHFAIVRPVFYLDYAFSPRFSIRMGTLQGGLAHKLPEPLYKYDLSFSDYNEEGIQFKVNTPNLKGDYWLDWRTFIQPGDARQEELAFGTASTVRLWKKESIQIIAPIYSMIYHRGGQIDVSNLPVRTFGNLAAGLKAIYGSAENTNFKASAELMLYHYFDDPGFPIFGETSGWALFPRGTLSWKNWFFSAGYWQADHFYSLTGEPQFQTLSEIYQIRLNNGKKLMKLQAGLHQNLPAGLQLHIFTSGYWDIPENRFDYAVGLQMIFNRTFGLLEF